MSIISLLPTTRHQVSQLKAKQARDAAKPVTVKTVNRVFGHGIDEAPKSTTGSIRDIEQAMSEKACRNQVELAKSLPSHAAPKKAQIVPTVLPVCPAPRKPATTSSTYRNNANVTDADRREAAQMFAEIARKQDNRKIMAEFNRDEEQADALESMRASDMAWINHEVEMAPRHAAYGW